MKRNNVFIAIIIAFIFSACQQPTPTYNKDYSNKKIFIRDLTVSQEYQANEIIRQLNNSNNKLETFVELAKQYSKQANGIWIDSNNMAPIFGNVLFEMSEGSITQTPIRNDKGYHVIYLEKKITKQQFRQLQAEYNQKELDRIASYEVNYLKEHNKLVKELPKHLETYVQPYNKKESCKIWMGYSGGNAYFEEDSYKIAWDGKCKNGYASGLGREIESADMMDKLGIAIYKKGKPTYYVTKDNLSDVLFEGIQDVRNDDSIGVTTIIKEKNNDIDVRTISGKYDGTKHISYNSYTSPFWNGSYTYAKSYLSFAYVYNNYEQNDMNNKISFEFFMKNKKGVETGWVIGKQKKSTSLITGESIDGKFKPFKLPQSYNDKADKILREIKDSSNKAYQAQEQAQKVKRQYLKRVCKKSVKVSWMDNDDYKDICSPKREIALMKKINAKLQKISEEKIARLEKQKYEEQQQKEEQHRQEMLNLERARLAEINRHNARVEAQEDSRQFSQSLNNLNKQIRDMTPKTYNVNVFHY